MPNFIAQREADYNPRNAPEEEAATLAAHRLEQRMRELETAAPCKCGVTDDDQVLFDFRKALENAGLGPLHRNDVVVQTLNAGLLIRRRA